MQANQVMTPFLISLRMRVYLYFFNGDGSDELFGGYLYMKKCPDSIEFDMETRRLLKDIHLFDVLRSDKSISSHGLEPRTPFLDLDFVNFYLSIPANYRFETNTLYYINLFRIIVTQSKLIF
jgi:asparagine synthase (glutamine-hydrolysing)